MDDELVSTRDEEDAELPPGHRYEASVSLTPDEVRQAFEQDPRVAWYPNADPPPFGSMNGDFEAWPIGPTTMIVRKNVPASIQLASPYVFIELAPLREGGTHVVARFVRRPPGVMLSRTVRVLIGVTCVFMLLLMAVYFAIIPLMMFHPGMWVTVVASVAGLFILGQYSKNHPAPESMAAFGAPLWGLVGNKLVPYVLGEGEDPFRLAAAKPSTSRS